MADINDLARGDFTPEELARRDARRNARLKELGFAATIDDWLVLTFRMAADKTETGEALTPEEQGSLRVAASYHVPIPDLEILWMTASEWADTLDVARHKQESFRKQLERLRNSPNATRLVGTSPHRRNGVVYSELAIAPMLKDFCRPFLPPKTGD